MKTIVSVQEISEFDIKPLAAVARWRALVEAEIARRWADRSSWIRVVWPTCKQEDAVPAFERFGVAYVECPTCGSLYAPFRPSEDELWAWYRESTPARFWREQLLPASEKARREKMMRPRADWVLDGIAEYVPSARRLVDISAYGRVLVDLVAAENPGLVEVMAAGMTADLEGGSTPRVRVQPTHVADLPVHGPADVVVAVDVLDRAADLRALVEALRQLLAPGGVFFATTPVASGFEIQTLWERSPTIIPPDKLNLPTVEGLYQIFAAPTWELLELSTPGMFDVEMVRRAIEAEPAAPWPRVVRALVERTDASGRTALVELLQSLRLTSFARLVARRKS
jgi:SAM-dependent methyltransferase